MKGLASQNSMPKQDAKHPEEEETMEGKKKARSYERGIKVKQFKYILLPVLAIAILKVWAIQYLKSEMQGVVVNSGQWGEEKSDGSVTQAARSMSQQFYSDSSVVLISPMIQSAIEAIAQANYQFSPQEIAHQQSNTFTISNAMAVNIAAVEQDNVPILRIDTSTNESIHCFMWIAFDASNNNAVIKSLLALNADQTSQVLNSYTRIFQVLRPIYVAYKKFFDHFIVFTVPTNAYMRYPAKATGNLIKGSSYDFKESDAYINTKAQFLSDGKTTYAFIDWNNSSGSYICVILTVGLQCQGQFCGMACMFFRVNAQTWKNLWFASQQNFFQQLDKILVISHNQSITDVSEAKSGSSSSFILPISDSLKWKVNQLTKIHSFTISQTKNEWLSCENAEMLATLENLGVFDICSISSKKELRINVLEKINLTSSNQLLLYQILIYLFMFFISYRLVYGTSIRFTTPVKQIMFKIDQITDGNFDIEILPLAKDSVKEIRVLCIELNELFQCIQFADDRYYQQQEDSVILIRLCGALKHFKKINYERGIGIVCNNMGQVHIQNQRYKEAIKYYKQALSIVENKILSVIGGNSLEQFYQVRPVNGWKSMSIKGEDERTVLLKQDDNENDHEHELDLEEIPDKIKQTHIFSDIFDFIILRKKKLLSKLNKKYQSSRQPPPLIRKPIQQQQPSPQSSVIRTTSMPQQAQAQTKQSETSTSSSIFAGLRSGSAMQSSSQQKQQPQQQQASQDQLPSQAQSSNPSLKLTAKAKMISAVGKMIQKKGTGMENPPQAQNLKVNARKLKRYEPLFITRCFQIANAYCIQAFDMKKTDFRKANLIAELAINKFLMVSKLLLKYESIHSNFRRHIMVLIRLNLLYLELADYNKYVARDKISQSRVYFNLAFDAYVRATEMLVEYKNRVRPEDREKDMMNQVSDFYNFLFLKGAGLYQDAFQSFHESLTSYKYYDPALRYSSLYHIKDILEHFNIEQPQALTNLIQAFNEHKQKDVVFVFDFTKTTKLNKTKKRCFDIFAKIYEKYIEEEDRVAYIRFDSTVNVVFELKNKSNNEIYFKKFVQDSIQIDPNGEPNLKRMCRSVYEGTKLFEKVEARDNSKWIVLITDNLRSKFMGGNELSVQAFKQLAKQREDTIRQLKEYLEKLQRVNLMIIGTQTQELIALGRGVKLNNEMKQLYKDLCQATHDGIFIEDGNNDDLDIALESISNVSQKFGGAAGSTGVSIQDFQAESFQNRELNDLDFYQSTSISS